MRNLLFFILLSVFVSGCSISTDGAGPSRPQVREPFLLIADEDLREGSERDPSAEHSVVLAPVGTELFAIVGIPQGALYASIQWFGPDGQDVRDAVVFQSNTGLASQINSEPFTLEVDTTVIYTVNGHNSRSIGDSPYGFVVSAKRDPDPEPEVTKVWVNPRFKTINVHEYFAVSWIVYCDDEACADQEVGFSSSNPTVVNVDNFGTVVGHSSGRAIITVRAEQDSSVSKTVTVTVR